MVDSPCNDICTTDLESGLCVGCGRTQNEIANWLIYSDREKTIVLKALKARNVVDSRK
tara:strand:- start:454 stop:627 length:174 start_codon:yes stop_codon:yes gene_type:complete